MSNERLQGSRMLDASEGPFQALAENATDAIVALDVGSYIRFVNAAAQRIFGYDHDELLDRPFEKLIPERLRERHRIGMERYVATGERRIPWSGIELPGLHRSGREIALEISFSEFTSNGERYFTGIMRDITDRKMAQRRRSIQQVITTALAESPNLEHATTEILTNTCKTLGWSVGILWQVDPDADVLRPVETWSDPHLEAAEFQAATRTTRLGPGAGLPGRVWRQKEPSWITDVSVDPSSPRARAAARAGLRTAFAFPVLLASDVLGVMEFFHHEIHQPDEELLELLASVGLQVGQFVHRKQTEVTMREWEEHYRFTLESAGTGTWEVDPATGEAVWSDTLFELYGIDPQQVTPSYRAWLAQVHPDDRDRRDAMTREIMRKDISYFEDEFRILHPQKGVRWMLTRGRITYGEDGAPLRMRGTVLDITDRRRAEEAVRELNRTLEERIASRTAELQFLNQELDAFSYSVSHDLRAPLRSLDGFSEALIEEYADKLEGTGHTYLERIRAGVERMRRLIDSMMWLSQHTRGDLDIRQVDLTSLASSIMQDLQEADPERNVSIEIEQGLYAWGDERLLRIALENLLGNGWKFTRGQQKARIEFRSEQHEGGSVFVVRDNGAGFDMAHAEQLFVPFRRLHSDHQFEGSGVGLTTVQRIIRRHEGRVWAQGKPGEGATFFFTLPLAPRTAEGRDGEGVPDPGAGAAARH